MKNKKEFNLLHCTATENFVSTFSGKDKDLDISIELVKKASEEYKTAVLKGNKENIAKKSKVLGFVLNDFNIKLKALMEK